MKHFATRVVLLLVSLAIAIPIGLSMLNPERRCGTSDCGPPLFWMLIFYTIWSIYLIIEAVLFHKKEIIIKRNYNLIMLLFLPILSLILWIYLVSID